MGESNSTLAATGFEGFGGFKGRTSLARLVIISITYCKKGQLRCIDGNSLIVMELKTWIMKPPKNLQAKL